MEFKHLAREIAAHEPTRAKYYEIRHQLDKVRGRWETLRENLKSSPIEILKDEISHLQQVYFCLLVKITFASGAS